MPFGTLQTLSSANTKLVTFRMLEMTISGQMETCVADDQEWEATVDVFSARIYTARMHEHFSSLPTFPWIHSRN